MVRYSIAVLASVIAVASASAQGKTPPKATPATPAQPTVARATPATPSPMATQHRAAQSTTVKKSEKAEEKNETKAEERKEQKADSLKAHPAKHKAKKHKKGAMKAEHKDSTSMRAKVEPTTKKP